MKCGLAVIIEKSLKFKIIHGIYLFNVMLKTHPVLKMDQRFLLRNLGLCKTSIFYPSELRCVIVMILLIL